MASNVISVAITSQTGGLRSGLKGAQGALGSFDQSTKRSSIGLGSLAKGFIGLAAVTQGAALFKSVVTSASNAQQSIGATETVFKSFSGTVVKDSKAAAKQFGLSGNEYRENANLIGSLFKNQGVASDKLAVKSKEMIGVGSDLAATFGGTTTDAVQALSSAFKGEMDPLEKYGISLKESTVSSEAYRLANVKSASEFGKLSKAQQAAAKQQATSNLIMKQSKDSAGAFGKETNTLAHQQQVLGAQVDNLKVAMGTRLLPVLTKIFAFVSNNGPAAFAALKAVLGPVIATVSSFVSGLTSGTGQASGKLAQFQATAASVFESVKSVFSSAVVIITALWGRFGGTLTTYVTTSLGNVLNFVRGFFTVLKGVFDVFAGILSGDWGRVWKGLKSIVSGGLTAVKAVISQAWNAITTVIRLAGTTIKALVSGAFNALAGAARAGVRALIDYVSGIPGKITGVFTGATTLLTTIGGQIVDGLVSGLSGAWHKVTDFVQSGINLIPKKIRSLMGIASPSKVTTKLGRYIAEGLAVGMLSGTGSIASAVNDLAKVLNEHLPAKIKKPKAIAKWYADHKKAIAKGSAEVLSSLRAASRERLAALKAQRAEYATAVSDAAKSYASLSGLQLGENENLTTGGIAQYLTDRLSAIRNFNAQLATLRAKGINDDLYNQIVQMGVEQGTGYAQALASSTPAAIAQVNSLQAQITGASAALGASTAGSLYTSGVQAAQGFHDGLQSSISKIEKAGLKISKALVKALKKALGIKSPSRVLKGLGKQSIAGLELGLDTKTVAARGAALSKALVTGYSNPTLAAEFAAGHRAEAILSAKPGSASHTYNITVQLDSSMTVEQQGVQYKKAIKAAERIGL